MPRSDPPRPLLQDEAEIARGEMIGRHVIVGVLGRGATGTVYKAFDTHLNRTLAIKMLHREHAWRQGGAPIELRMQREAQAMARLSHPNVVVVHDVGVYDHRIFLAMEFVDGGTLKAWMRGEHTWRERLAVVMSAGRGLAAAHAAGLIHRDFKPDNVLVGKDGRVLVTDFGLARIADLAEDSREPSTLTDTRAHPADAGADAATLSATPPVASTRPPPSPMPRRPVASPPPPLPASTSLTSPLTLTGSVMGTVGYMAPEQAFGEPTNAASDQFSFCVTLYFALYGHRPFAGEDIDAYFASLERPLPHPPQATEVPAWVHRILARGLARSPDERFPSMEALLGALAADPEVFRQRAKRRHRTIAAVVATAAIAALATGVAIGRQTEECTPDPADLKGIWDDSARADLSDAFDRSGVAGARDLSKRVTSVMNDTASRWTAMKADSCRATRVKRRQSEDDYRLRGECLDRRRNELRALSGSLRVADKDVVEKALSAAYGLTNVTVCADVPMLRKSGGLPDAPEARARVLEARADLARASSLQLVGKLPESTKQAVHALELARSSRHDTTVAEALHVLGALKLEQNEHAQAERFLTESSWTASKAGADSLVVATASMTAFVVGSKLGRPGEARVWLGVAEAALGRVGASQELELEFEEHKSWILADGNGRAEETIPAQERIAQTYEQLYGVHPRTLRALYNLGDALTSAGNHKRACEVYARAVTMGDSIGGANYSWTGYSLGGRGDCLAAQGEYAAADRALERAIQIFETTADDYSEAETIEVVIRSALAQGDITRAAANARKALDLMKNLDGTSSLVAIVNVPVAEALMLAPPAPEAETLCAEALRQQELLSQVDPGKTLRADALRCLGEALILEGRPGDAVAPLERSLTIPRRTYPGDLARARFDLARALALSKGDPLRAKALAREARDELATAPGLKYELEIVERWLAARP
jgi:serine/threonine protein kinase